LFTIRIVVSLPCGEPLSTRFAQGSTVAAPLELAELLELVVGEASTTVVPETSKVDMAIGVLVIIGVAVGVSVGGRGVAVGMAACVSATTVKAAATAVDCTFSELMVGTAGG
jgi:hypothetical protein